MIRNAHAGDHDAVVGMMVAYVERTPYAEVYVDPAEHASVLFAASLGQGVLLVDEVAGVVMGALVVLVTPYMGSVIAEEVGWWHPSPRVLLELLDVAQCQVVQKGATVLKVSAPSWTSLGRYFKRRGFAPLEVVYTRALTPHGHARRSQPQRCRPGTTRSRS